MSELSLVDYGFILIVLISGVISLFRGFIKEAVSLVSWIVGVWAAWTFDETLAEVLSPWISDPVVLIWGARILIFVFVLVAGGVLGVGLTMLMNKTGLTATDRIFGSLFGLARGVLLIAVLILVLEMIGFTKSAWWQESKLIPYAAPVTDEVRKLVSGGVNYFDGVNVPDISMPESLPQEAPEGSGETST